ncbi:hypothetical protein SAMN05518861_112173 [Mesorhizobium sp. YR577]|nr:hypothetical protein SAMN05518861_112173 [Mesorhizobium sp. YR577]
MGSLRQCSASILRRVCRQGPHPLPSLRSVRDLPSRGRLAPAHLFIATPGFHRLAIVKDRERRATEISLIFCIFLRSFDRPSRCLSRSRPVTTPAPCTFHGQDAAGSPHGFGQRHLRRARSTPACVGPSGPWLPHQGGRSPPLPLDPGSRPGPAGAMGGLCGRCFGVWKDWARKNVWGEWKQWVEGKSGGNLSTPSQASPSMVLHRCSLHRWSGMDPRVSACASLMLRPG